MVIDILDAERAQLVNEINQNAVKVHRLFMRELSHKLQPHQLTAHQFLILWFLRSHPNASQAQIAAEFCIEAQSVVKLIDNLEQEGWVFRTVDPTDRRVRRISLNGQNEALSHIFDMFLTLQASVLSLHSTEELQVQSQLYCKMEAVMKKD